MRMWLRELDRILRGEATRPSALQQGNIQFPVGGLTFVVIVLGMIQGICMGCFALFKAGGPVYMQLVASAVKVPALFFLTLLVTLPSLYVSNALVGSRLSISALIRLLVASLGVTMATLASLGPIVAFFSIITTSYPFILLLNVFVFAVSGFLGLLFLLRTLHRLSIAMREAAEAKAPSDPPAELAPPPNPGAAARGEGALDRVDDRVFGRHVKTVFRCWVLLFGLVGAQMGWVLRPFVGDPNTPFAWFRPRQSNFFEAVLHALASLFA